MKTIFVLVVTLLAVLGYSLEGRSNVIDSKGSLPLRTEVLESSEYLGTVHVTSKPLAYITGLPRFDEVSRFIRQNTFTIFADEVDRRLSLLRNSCANCIGKDRITTPIRVEFIPAGTTFTVIGEYLYDSNTLFSSPIHMLIVTDEHGNSAEVLDITFKLDVAQASTVISRQTEAVLKNIELFKENSELTLSFCLGDYVKTSPNPSDFLQDFQMTDEVSFTSHNGRCDGGYLFTFKTLESYLTSVYYFREWSLHGEWSNSFHKPEIPPPPKRPVPLNLQAPAISWGCRSYIITDEHHPGNPPTVCADDTE